MRSVMLRSSGGDQAGARTRSTEPSRVGVFHRIGFELGRRRLRLGRRFLLCGFFLEQRLLRLLLATPCSGPAELYAIGAQRLLEFFLQVFRRLDEPLAVQSEDDALVGVGRDLD